MTTATPTFVPDALPAPPAPRTETYRQTSIARLTILELRKFFATRAGIGLAIGAMVLMAAISIVVAVSGTAADHAFRNLLEEVVLTASVLMPVLSVMLFTSEWTTRSSLTTFALTPQRWRVFTAKLAASVVFAVVGFGIAASFAAGGVLLAGDAPDPWNVSIALFAQTGLWAVLSSLVGAGLASMILITPAAIVALFMLPTLIDLLSMWERMREPLDWIAQESTINPLAEGALTSAGDWAHVAVGAALWVALPLTLGARRIMRSDIS